MKEYAFCSTGVNEIGWLLFRSAQHADFILRKYAAKVRRDVSRKGSRPKYQRSFDRDRRVFAQRCVWLRLRLQKTPWWARGHLALGISELRLQEHVGEHPHPRGLEAMQVSAQAALLIQDQVHAPLTTSLQLESEYLLAMAAFLRKDYELAHVIFQKILTPERAVLFCEEIYYQALENAAACAMALSENNQALAFLLLIPQHVLTNESRIAVDTLRP